MASSSVNTEFDDEQVERFDDFTLASSWERFISEIESTCRKWLSNGSKMLMKTEEASEISYNLFKVKRESKYASKSYTVEYYFEGKSRDNVEEWDPELHELQLCFGVKNFLVIFPQSANGVVLDTPEASKLLSAVAVALTNCSSLLPAFVPVHDPSRKAYIGIQNLGTVYTRRFEADHLSSQVPVKYMHLEGLYELFVSKFAFTTIEMAMHQTNVLFLMKSTYKTCVNEDDDSLFGDDEYDHSNESTDGKIRHKTHWDEDCPWSEWYSAEDPVNGFELIAIWLEKTVTSSLEMAELENSSPYEAEQWTLVPILSSNFLEGRRVGFASQLLLLLDTLALSYEAQFMEDFVSVENPTPENVKPSMVMPSPTALDRILKDLFQGEGKRHDVDNGDHNKSKSIKGAPYGSLFSRFCLHCLWFGNCNIRAIAVLWIEFIREVRWCWEESQPLPKMSLSNSVDLSTCLINQKLQMLAICIEKKIEMEEDYQDCIDSPVSKDDSDMSETELPTFDIPILNETDSTRRGSKGEVPSMMLLNSNQCMHAPYTQDPPLMTEDMLEERFQAQDFSAQLEKDILLSDMSAFKAANPDGVFEDFIRWHSPGDWVGHDSEGRSWPPRGELSKRMSEKGNQWRRLWDEAPAVSAGEQKPLLDAVREGEKALHYLETVPAAELLEQMVCGGFRASAETVGRSEVGEQQGIKAKMEQVLCTLGSSLRQVSKEEETMGDLKRMCAVLEGMEKVVAVAASLHEKLKQAPRLADEFLKEISMGKWGLGEQKVGPTERQPVATLFAPPSPSQSWRKAFTMGNLLNAREPLFRQIIFSLSDPHSQSYRMYICASSNDLRVALAVSSHD